MVQIWYSFCDVLATNDTVVVGLYRVASNMNDKNGTLLGTCLLANDTRGNENED